MKRTRTIVGVTDGGAQLSLGALMPKLEQEPGMNPNTGTMEFALRDPDGYYVMVSALPAA